MGTQVAPDGRGLLPGQEISWTDWDHADHDLHAFTRQLIGLRRAQPALRPRVYRQAPGGSSDDTVVVVRSDAQPFTSEEWTDPHARSVGFLLEHTGADAFCLLLNSAENGVEFTVPAVPHGAWRLATSSDPGQRVTPPTTSLIISGTSFTLLQSPLVDGA